MDQQPPEPQQLDNAATWNEADTCRRLVTPRLQAAGWDTDPHPLPEQRNFRFNNVHEIIGKFGGAERLREAVGQLQTLLYAE